MSARATDLARLLEVLGAPAGEDPASASAREADGARALARNEDRAGALARNEDRARALARSAALLAGLRAHAEACPRGRPGRGSAPTRERAERELRQLIVRELERLCGPARAVLDPRDLRELLAEELACAESLGRLPAGLLRRLRELAASSPWGPAEHAGLDDCVRALRRLPR